MRCCGGAAAWRCRLALPELSSDLPVTGTHIRAGSCRSLGVWSNAVVFVRVWEYEVPGDRAAAFTTAYAADGAWGELFGRAGGSWAPSCTATLSGSTGS